MVVSLQPSPPTVTKLAPVAVAPALRAVVVYPTTFAEANSAKLTVAQSYFNKKYDKVVKNNLTNILENLSIFVNQTVEF